MIKNNTILSNLLFNGVFFFVSNLQHGGLVSLHTLLSPKSDSLFSHLLLPPCLCLSHTLTVLTVWVSWWEFLFGIRRTRVRARWRAKLHVRTVRAMPYWTDTEHVGAVYIQVLSLYVCVFVCQLPKCAPMFSVYSLDVCSHTVYVCGGEGEGEEVCTGQLCDQSRAKPTFMWATATVGQR